MASATLLQPEILFHCRVAHDIRALRDETRFAGSYEPLYFYHKAGSIIPVRKSVEPPEGFQAFFAGTLYPRQDRDGVPVAFHGRRFIRLRDP